MDRGLFHTRGAGSGASLLLCRHMFADCVMATGPRWTQMALIQVGRTPWPAGTGENARVEPGSIDASPDGRMRAQLTQPRRQPDPEARTAQIADCPKDP